MPDYKYPALDEYEPWGINTTSPENKTPEESPYDKGNEQVGKITPIRTVFQSMRTEVKKIREPPDIRITCPQDIDTLLKKMGDLDREYVVLCQMNGSGQVIAIEEISIGTLNYAPITPRELVKGAIINGAASVILVHNHPSGSAIFSSQDVDIAKAAQVAFGFYQITLRDFIVITRDGYTSMREIGQFPFREFELQSSYAGMIGGMKEGDDDRDLTDDEVRCNIASIVAQDTLRENCRRNTSQGVSEPLELASAETIAAERERCRKLTEGILDIVARQAAMQQCMKFVIVQDKKDLDKLKQDREEYLRQPPAKTPQGYHPEPS